MVKTSEEATPRSVSGSSKSAAAAKAAAKALVTGELQARVEIKLPRKGEERRVGFPVERCEVSPDRLSAEAVVVNEAPTALGFQETRLPVRRPGGFFFSASGGLGFGLPAAVGVALADPSRPVLAVIGDGSMQYAIQALATAAAQQAGAPRVAEHLGQAHLVAAGEEHAVGAAELGAAGHGGLGRDVNDLRRSNSAPAACGGS